MATGAVAGAAATVVMTVAQLHVFPRLLPRRYQRRFLPRQVLRGAQRRLLGTRLVHGDDEDRLVLAAHHAFGTSAGAAFGLLRRRLPRLRPDRPLA